MNQITINGSKYFYQLSGVGHPVILIAGYTRDLSAWFPITAELSKHYQILLFDNLGAGRTQYDGETITASRMAKDIIALADALQLTNPHIVGHSMGGTVAQIIASQYPDKINKLCLLGTSCLWREAMLFGLRSTLKMRERGIDFDLIFEANLPWIFGQTFLKDETKISMLKESILLNPYPQSLENQQRQFYALQEFNGRDALKAITAPTLIGYGIEDLISLPYESQFLQQQIKGSEIFALNCGHGFMMEAPDELAKAVISFLR